MTWSLEQIEAQAARGGVNRQQAEQLAARVRELEAAIRRHRQEVWASRSPQQDFAADTKLWKLVGKEDVDG